MIALLVPIVVAMFLYSSAAPAFTAHAKLLLGGGREYQNNPEVGNATANAPVSTKQEVVNSELEILTSRDLARAVLDDLGFETVFPDIAKAGPPSDVTVERAIDRMTRSLAVRPVRSSDIIDLDFEARTPDLAQRVLSKIAELYQQKHIQVFARPISSFLDTQVAGFAHNLNVVESEIAELKTAKNLFSIDDERRQLLDSRTTLVQTVTQLRSRSAELQSRIEQLERMQQETPQSIQLYSETEQSDALERARSQLLDLQLQDLQLSSRFADENRGVQTLRSQIAVLKDYVAKKEKQFSGRVRNGRNPLYDEIVAEVTRANAELKPGLVRADTLEAEIERVDERLRTISEAERILTGLDRERDALEASLKTYRQRQSDARIAEELDRQKIVSIRVVQEPAASSAPTSPKLLTYAAVGVGAGVGCVVLLLGLLFALRNTFIAPEGVESSTSIPVLVSLPAR